MKYRNRLTPWWEYNKRMYAIMKLHSKIKDNILLWIFHFKGGEGNIHPKTDIYAIHRDNGVVIK